MKRIRQGWWAGLLPLMLLLLALTPAAALAGAGARPVGQNPAVSQPVYALPGTLRPAQNQRFSTYLVTFDGDLYGLAGETPTVESQIVQYREMGPNVEVKVWGRLYPEGRTGPIPEIVVSSILPISGAPATPTPTPTPTRAAPTIYVRVQALNVRSGPDVGYPRIGGIQFGDVCEIIGRNAQRTWWQVRCPNGLIGWVSANFVLTSGNTGAVPVVETPPPPPPTPTPVPPPPTSFTNWKASFYTNRDLAGSPALIQDVRAINFNWGRDAPASNIPADNFSARFERTINFPTAAYELAAQVDDGVRVYVDNQLVIDSWQIGSSRRLSAQRLLSGNHYIRVDYFEAGGDALIQFGYDVVRTSSDWEVRYYNNISLSGNPVLNRGEPRGHYPLDYNWGAGSPAPGVVDADEWSGHWVGIFDFEGGDYDFSAIADDGVRVYIDGIRVIDAWSDGYKERSNRFYGIGAGRHEVRVEFYERFGGAALRVWWSRINTSGGGRPRDE